MGLEPLEWCITMRHTAYRDSFHSLKEGNLRKVVMESKSNETNAINFEFIVKEIPWWLVKIFKCSHHATSKQFPYPFFVFFKTKWNQD